MKKSKIALKKLTAILLSALLITSLPAFHLSSYAAETVGDLGATSGTTGDCTWAIENGVLTISGNGAMADYNSLSDAPWKECDFSEVIIENGVTNIGNYAFYNLTNLTSVTIPDSVTGMGDNAFFWCYNLTSITIPDSVTNIGNETFEGCSELTSITIPNSVITIGSLAFSSCYNLASLTIPDSVTSIGVKAFDVCINLSSITVDKNNAKYDSRNNCNAIIETESNCLIQGCKNTVIPDNVTSIGRFAFKDCSNLTSITIPNSVTSISGDAFYRCTKLTNITIPNSVTKIGSWAFFGCNSLTDVYYHGTQESWNSINIGSYNEKLTKANIHFIFLGDINQNGTLEINDCTEIQYHLAYLETLTDDQLAVADVDDNSAVDIRDVTLIQKYLAGFDVELAQ